MQFCLKPFKLLRPDRIVELSARTFLASSKQKEYHGRKLVGYSCEQMYTVVSDVANYKHFVPFCKKSTVRDRRPGYMKADLQVGFPPIVESYTSHVTLVENQLVAAECVDGSIFNFLHNEWRFGPGLRSNPRSCIVDFTYAEFRTALYGQVAQMFFEKLVEQMEWAFIAEARRRYGAESVPSHKLTAPKVHRS